MREANRERVANFLLGASIPTVIIAPIAGYLAIKGDYQAAIDTVKASTPIMAAWGLYGMGDFQGTYAERQRRRDLRKGSRRSVKEVLLEKMPTPPNDVTGYLKKIYEDRELDALTHGDALITQSDPFRLSGNIASRVTDNLFDAIMNGRERVYSLPEQEVEIYAAETDALIHLVQFGWQVKAQRERGFAPELNENEPYSTHVVADIVASWACEKFVINSKSELTSMLEVISVPTYLRK
jgi:hypothetical protein